MSPIKGRLMITIPSASDNCFVNMNPTASILFNKNGIIKGHNDWRGTALQKTKGLAGKPESSFYKVIKPVIYCLRMIGGFPYIEHKGIPHFKLFSCWTFYSIVFITVEIILLYLRTQTLFSNKRNIFDSILRSQIKVLINMFQAFGPITVWFEIAGILKYFSKCHSLQEDLNAYNMVLDTKLKKWTYGLLLLGLIYIISVSYFEASNHENIFYLPAVIIIHANTFLTLLLVLITGFFSKFTAISLIKFIKSSHQTKEIVVGRKLWIKLAQLTIDLGNVLGPTIMEWLLLGSTVTILSSYSLIFLLDGVVTDNTVNQTEMIKSGVFFLIISSLMLIFLCEFGHRCSSSVGKKVQTELLHLNLMGRDKEYQRELNNGARTTLSGLFAYQEN